MCPPLAQSWIAFCIMPRLLPLLAGAIGSKIILPPLGRSRRIDRLKPNPVNLKPRKRRLEGARFRVPLIYFAAYGLWTPSSAPLAFGFDPRLTQCHAFLR